MLFINYDIVYSYVFGNMTKHNNKKNFYLFFFVCCVEPEKALLHQIYKHEKDIYIV